MRRCSTRSWPGLRCCRSRFGTLFSSPEALRSRRWPCAHRADHRRRSSSRSATALEWSLRGYYDPARAVELLLDGFRPRAFEASGEPSRSRPALRYFQEKRLIEEARREHARRAATLAADGVRYGRSGRSPRTPGRCRFEGHRSARPGKWSLHETFSDVGRDRSAGAIATMIARRPTSEPVEGLLTLEPSGPWPPFHFCPDLGETLGVSSARLRDRRATAPDLPFDLVETAAACLRRAGDHPRPGTARRVGSRPGDASRRSRRPSTPSMLARRFCRSGSARCTSPESRVRGHPPRQARRRGEAIARRGRRVRRDGPPGLARRPSGRLGQAGPDRSTPPSKGLWTSRAWRTWRARRAELAE